jgi:hypothetical protein
MTRIPDELFNEQTLLRLPVLRNKCVVYQVWNCPGYYMYLSSRCESLAPLLIGEYNIFHALSNTANENVAISLRTNITVPAGPGINANPGVNIGWTNEGCTGVSQHAYRPDLVYTPLFCLRSIRRPLLRRDEGGLGVEA